MRPKRIASSVGLSDHKTWCGRRDSNPHNLSRLRGAPLPFDHFRNVPRETILVRESGVEPPKSPPSQDGRFAICVPSHNLESVGGIEPPMNSFADCRFNRLSYTLMVWVTGIEPANNEA